MYESKAEQAERRATRRDWTLTTSIDPSTTHLLVTVSSDAGWGNAGVRNFDYHVDAVKARVRREIRKTYPDVPFSLEVHSTRSYGDGVMYAITYFAKLTGEVKEIGDRSPDGLLEITDTGWNGLYPSPTLFVTVRETMGGNCLIGGYPQEKARRLARGALKGANKTSIINRFTSGTCEHVTFAVSRLDS